MDDLIKRAREFLPRIREAYELAISCRVLTGLPQVLEQLADALEAERKARQQVPAEVRLWRKELERLTGFASVASGSERARLAALRDLVILANVIASGRGQAVVPEGVAAALGKESAHGVGQWMRYHGGNVELFRLIDGRHATAQEMLVAINTYGDSLCGAP